MWISAWFAAAALCAAPEQESPEAPLPEARPPGPPAAGGVLVRSPLQGTAPCGTLSVVLVGAVANASDARSVHALVARRGEWTRWVRLPLEELPAAVVVPDPETIHCLTEGERIVTFDAGGAPVGSADLDALLPVAGARDRAAPITVAYDAGAPCLAVPMLCGRLALVGHDADATEPYSVCSLIRPARLVCGAEVWLEQAHELARRGDQVAALYAYESAIEASPEDARGYRELARHHGRTSDHGARLACLRTGLERLFAGAPAAVDERWRVGTAEARLAMEYVEASREADGAPGAQRALDLALGLYPCLSEAVLLRAELHLAGDDETAALACIEAALARLEPDALAAAHHDVGRFLLRQGRARVGLRFLEDAYALGERSEFLLRALADLSEQLGDYDRAGQWLETLRRTWRRIDNGGSEPERDARWARRLAELDDQIARVAALAAARGATEH